jgi:hypothetical protein
VLACKLVYPKKNDMKQLIIFSAILFSGAMTASAQNFHFGIKGGADLHKIQGYSFKEKFDLGYHAGVFAQIGLPGKLGLQPEIYYSQVNTEVANSTTDIYGMPLMNVSEIKLSYINIPILLNFKVLPVLSLQAGPQFGIMTDKNKSVYQSGKETFKSGDVGLAAGLQLDLAKLRIYGRYVNGLNNINNGSTDKWKNQTLQFGIGLRIF